MAQKVLILGDSGTGKSASLRNLDPNDTAIINCVGKALPFRNSFFTLTPEYETMAEDVKTALKKAQVKTVVIDDAQYIMSYQYMRHIKETGWDKFNQIQSDFFEILRLCDELPEDTIVYILSHIARDDNGFEKIKTMGKMLDNMITIEGMFTIVLKSFVNDGKYYFATQNSGRDTVKSPIGMFNTFAIDNDLAFVNDCIRNYYGMTAAKTDEEIQQASETAERPEIEKPERRRRQREYPEQEPETRTRRRRTTEEELPF